MDSRASSTTTFCSCGFGSRETDTEDDELLSTLAQTDNNCVATPIPALYMSCPSYMFFQAQLPPPMGLNSLRLKWRDISFVKML